MIILKVKFEYQNKHMQKAIAVALLALLSEPVRLSAQSDEVRFLIDTSISIMRQYSVNSGAVDWDKLRNRVLKEAVGLNSPYQLGPVMRSLYSALNDFHGAFFYRDSTFRWSHNVPAISDSISNEWKKRSGIKTLVLERDIGYLRIPSMPVASRADFSKKAQALNDSLCSLLVKNVKGMILDLRLNGGGAMHPMILGVEQLLQPGNIGSFRGGKKEDWLIKDDGFYVDTILLARIEPRCAINAGDIPVVLLISPVTGSAAECLVVSFKGRRNTILLGTPTAGYVTAVAGFSINDTAFMNLAVGYSADRNGNIYREAIQPDMAQTSPDSFNDIVNDEKVKAAEQWLRLHLKR
jgi:C-terminal processing protease CtpA/Prc